MILWQATVVKYLLPVAVAGLVLWMAYAKIYDRGYRAAYTECAASALKADEINDAAASAAGTALTEELGQTLPAAEEKTNVGVERIRTVYVDRPVAAECAWRDGVFEELEAGRAAANRAVRGGAGSDNPTDP